MSRPLGQDPPGSAGPGAVQAPLQLLLLLAAFIGAALIAYGPALDGPFLSDDLHYVATNPYVQELTTANLTAILDPTSPATVFVVNYAPVQMLIHALEWQLFGDQTRGYHLVNVVLHALASVLLVALLVRSRIPPVAAVLAGALFLLHPANVEAVAWISQLKSSSCLVLTLAALLAWPRRPGLATLCFALGLLSKPMAVCALPAAALFDHARGQRPRVAWLVLWTLLFSAYAYAEFGTHNRTGEAAAFHEDPLVLARSIFALGARYLVMATTSLGTSAFHEPPPALSWLDPWWLLGLLLIGGLTGRSLWALMRRREEAAWWAIAAISFAPISQIFPFLYPMADRYLYFILPGLLGGLCLMGSDFWRRWGPVSSAGSDRTQALAGRIALLTGVALLGVFAVGTHARASIWRSSAHLVADAARHYPDGVSAHMLRARRLARRSDFEGALDALEGARDRGFNRHEQLLRDPALSPLREHPRFRALVSAIAAGWLAWGDGLENPTQMELRLIAIAHIARREHAEAERYLERALEEPGPIAELIRGELELVRRAKRGEPIQLVP